MNSQFYRGIAQIGRSRASIGCLCLIASQVVLHFFPIQARASDAGDSAQEGERVAEVIGDLEFWTKLVLAEDNEPKGQILLIDEKAEIAIELSKAKDGFRVVTQKSSFKDRQSVSYCDEDGDGVPEWCIKTDDGHPTLYKVEVKLTKVEG